MEIMEQTRGNLPQLLSFYAFKGIQIPQAIANLLYFNKLEQWLLPASLSIWHINCLILGERIQGMIDLEKRVLVIDSDVKDRRDLAHFLKSENYSVETCKNLSEAIKKISQEGYNCLVMDVNLPEMKGYEAVSILKNLDPKVKVIMTTKKNSKKLEAKVRQQDIFFYFIKSFGKEELKLAIKNAFNQ